MHSHEHHTHPKTQPEEELHDPVCGMKVSQDSQFSAQYADQSYHFCSAKCQAKFAAEPERYLTEKPANTTSSFGEQASTTGAAEYTCPMHPEIRQPAPGVCPKCGMTLEPLMPALDDEDNPELTDFTRRFWWTLPLTIIVTILAMGGHTVQIFHGNTQNWVELALATPVTLWAGWPFFVRCVQSFVQRSPNMWTLIGLGTSAAYLYSIAATFFPAGFPSNISTRWPYRGVFRSRSRNHLADLARTNLGAQSPLANFSGDQVLAGSGPENSTQNQHRWQRRRYPTEPRAFE